MVFFLRMALAAGLFPVFAFCVFGFLITLESPDDLFCRCVYSVLIILCGTSMAQLIRPASQGA